MNSDVRLNITLLEREDASKLVQHTLIPSRKGSIWSPVATRMKVGFSRRKKKVISERAQTLYTRTVTFQQGSVHGLQFASSPGNHNLPTRNQNRGFVPKWQALFLDGSQRKPNPPRFRRLR